MYTFISLALFLGIAEVYARCHVNLRPGWRKQLMLRALALAAGLVCGVAAVDMLFLSGIFYVYMGSGLPVGWLGFGIRRMCIDCSVYCFSF